MTFENFYLIYLQLTSRDDTREALCVEVHFLKCQLVLSCCQFI